MLKTLRGCGYRAVIYEAADNLGGTWRWNAYPGAKVDSEVPQYEFSWPEIWKTRNWTTNYPECKKIRECFDHVDKVLGIKKDCSFHTLVTGAEFDTEEGRWNVRTQDGRSTQSKYLILGTGFSAKRYVPEWPGIDEFQGIMKHSSFWTDDQVCVENNKCAVIGTGASGVQIVEAWAPVARELKVFQRTPNLAIPMRRRTLTAEEQEANKQCYERLFSYRQKTSAGFHYDWCERNALEESAQQRRERYEKAWAMGGFRFWLSVYKDSLASPASNRESYSFWADKCRSRILDPRKRDLLAPLKMPHYFGIKRPRLDDPIARFTPTGIVLESGAQHDFDVVVLATGFDIVTGAMTQLGLKSIDDEPLEEQWADGASTYLGMTVHGYPNMFHIYGLHAPTLLSNGPSSIEVQGRWVADCLDKMEHNNIKYINPKADAARAWKKHIVDLCGLALFGTTQSTFVGVSISGKVHEPVCFHGGLPLYAHEIRRGLDTMEGFEVVGI